MSPWTSFSTTAASYTSNAGLDALPPNVIRRFRDTYMPGSSILPSAPEVVAYRHIDPMKIASLSGKQYEAMSDPPIQGLEHGVGVIRPIGSFISEDDDEWWEDIGSVVKKMIITAGERECFRDDIVGFAESLQKAAGNQHIDGKDKIVGGSTQGSQMELELVMDDSFHAVLLSDFAFRVPPGVLAIKLSGWLAKAFSE
jgi:acetyl esterase/lipase